MSPRSLTIIINGATGVGKTTTADYLSRKLDCRSISTDTVRQQLRDRPSYKRCPVVSKSSYEFETNSSPPSPDRVIANYVAQAATVVEEIRKQYLGTGDECTIFEGVHLNRNALSILATNEYVVLFLRMPGIDEHRRRLLDRNLRNRGINNKHFTYLNNIRTIGAFLDYNWTLEARTNGRIIEISGVQDVDSILGRVVGWGYDSVSKQMAPGTHYRATCSTEPIALNAAARRWLCAGQIH